MFAWLDQNDVLEELLKISILLLLFIMTCKNLNFFVQFGVSSLCFPPPDKELSLKLTQQTPRLKKVDGFQTFFNFNPVTIIPFESHTQRRCRVGVMPKSLALEPGGVGWRGTNLSILYQTKKHNVHFDTPASMFHILHTCYAEQIL